MLPETDAWLDRSRSAAHWAPCGPRSRVAIFQVWRIQFCIESCTDAHLEDGRHIWPAYLASTQARAEQYIRAHATDEPTTLWEVWETRLDDYAPFERPDDGGLFWTYAGDGTEINAYELWHRYEAPLFGWAWSGADVWSVEAEARARAR